MSCAFFKIFVVLQLTTRLNELEPVVNDESLEGWVIAVVVIFTVLILSGVVCLLAFVRKLLAIRLAVEFN